MANPDSILFIDSEFTDNTLEILELCVINGAGDIIYHNFFKPRKASHWRTFPHGITKAKVRDCSTFKKSIAEIQPIFDRAELVAGFAVDNDISHLGDEGLAIDEKKAMDLRELFWVLKKDDDDAPGPYNVPGLTACAKTLGVEMDMDAEHTAKGDTITTRKLFLELSGRLDFCDWSDIPSAWQKCHDIYVQGVDAFNRANARKHIILKKADGGYTISASQLPAATDGDLSIEVENKFKALWELKSKFSNRMRRDSKVYALKPTDINYFKNYSNTYDSEEYHTYKKLLNTYGKNSLNYK